MKKVNVNFAAGPSWLLRGPAVWLGYLGLVVVMFGFLLVGPNLVGISYDWNTPLNISTFERDPLTSAWSNGETVPPGNGIYYWSLYQGLMSLGLSSQICFFLILVTLLSLSGYFMWLMLRSFGLKFGPALLGGFVYLASTQLFLLLHHGYMYSVMSFCFTPLFVYMLSRYQRKPQLHTALLGALVFSVSATQTQFFAVNAIITLIVMLVSWRSFRSAAVFLVGLFVVNVLLSSSWISLYASVGLSGYSSSILQAGQGVFERNAVMDLFYLPFVNSAVREYFQSLYLGWFHLVWQIAQILIFAVPLVIIGWVGRAAQSRAVSRPLIIGLVTVAAGLLLAKGNSEPFDWIGRALYALPLSGLFRDINHWYYLVTFGGAVAFSAAVSLAFEFIHRQRPAKSLMIGVMTFSVVLGLPLIANVYRSKLHTYQLDQPAYQALLDGYNQAKRADERILWLPFGLYVHFNDNQPQYSGVNPLVRSVIQQESLDAPVRDGQPSIARQLIHFGSCDRIPRCPERMLGLLSVNDIVHLKRDFSSAVTGIESHRYFRQADIWTTEYVSEWLKNRKLLAQSATTDAYDIYSVPPSLKRPLITVPSGVDHVVSENQGLLDGVTLEPDSGTSFTVGRQVVGQPQRVIVPVDFSDAETVDLQHNAHQIFATVNIPQADSYDFAMYQKRAASTSPLTLLAIKDVNHSQRKIFLEKLDRVPRQFVGQNPAVTSEVDLRQGKYQLVISNSLNVQNLVYNPSFSDGPWPGRYADCPLSGDARAAVVSDREHGDFLELRNTRDGACQGVVIGDLERHQKYLFSVSIRHLSGAFPEICISTTEESDCQFGSSSRSNSRSWQTRELVVETGDSNRAIIRMAVPGSSQQSVNFFDNVEFRRIDLPETLAFSTDRDQPVYNIDRVTYEKVTPTTYRVRLTGASGRLPLVFSENFHDGWSLSVVHGQAATVGGHGRINGNANLWYVDAGSQAKDLDLLIEFAPQRWFRLGQIIALLTAVTSLIVIAVSYRRSRRRLHGSQEQDV